MKKVKIIGKRGPHRPKVTLTCENPLCKKPFKVLASEAEGKTPRRFCCRNCSARGIIIANMMRGGGKGSRGGPLGNKINSPMQSIEKTTTGYRVFLPRTWGHVTMVFHRDAFASEAAALRVVKAARDAMYAAAKEVDGGCKIKGMS